MNWIWSLVWINFELIKIICLNWLRADSVVVVVVVFISSLYHQTTQILLREREWDHCILTNTHKQDSYNSTTSSLVLLSTLYILKLQSMLSNFIIFTQARSAAGNYQTKMSIFSSQQVQTSHKTPPEMQILRQLWTLITLARRAEIENSFWPSSLTDIRI